MSKRGPNWSMEEDEALCQSWCKVSCDGDIGNGQKIKTFWERIKAAYKAIMPGTDRTEQSMESRYKAVGRTSSKWKANAQCSSGQIEDDVTPAQLCFLALCSFFFLLLFLQASGFFFLRLFCR